MPKTAISRSTEVSLEDLADVTGKTKSWLTELARKGYFKSVERGVYRLGEVVDGLVRNAGEAKKTPKQADATLRLQNARAAEIEQRTAIDAKELMYSADHRAILDLLVGGLRAEMESLPAQLTRDRMLRAEYEEKINALMVRLSARWDRMSQTLEADILAEEEDEEAE